MKLFINTTIPKEAIVSLIDQNEKLIDQEKSTQPLVAVAKLLKKAGIKLEDIEEIQSHPGPGSFTGLRIGAAVASGLNFALGKKIEPAKIRYEVSKSRTNKKAPKTSR